MPKSKPFRTKIPAELHEKIYEWYCVGVSQTAMLQKLETEHAFHTNFRTLQRLLQYLKDQKQQATSAAIAHMTQKQVITDFDELNKAFADVKELAEQSRNIDNTLFLKSIDRLIKLLQIKFAISIDANVNIDSEKDKDSILDSLLAKLGDK